MNARDLNLIDARKLALQLPRERVNSPATPGMSKGHYAVGCEHRTPKFG